jgi:hypothetical protein
MRIHFPQARGGWNVEGSLPPGISKSFLNQGNQAEAINMKNPITMIVMAGFTLCLCSMHATTIHGKVTDESGKLMAGVMVSAFVQSLADGDDDRIAGALQRCHGRRAGLEIKQ